MLFALPALLVPVIEIPLVLWARSSFMALHPEYYTDPPTISRSINDPAVGVPFADLILLITALILTVLPMLTLGYLLAISRLTLSRPQRLLMYALLLLMFVLQLSASSGMVLTTQYSLGTNDHLHMLGSYIFFIFQGVTILVAGTLCQLLVRQQRAHGIPDHEWQFRPAMHRFRFRFALVIAGLVALYGVLFAIRKDPLPISAYAVQVIYTQCEVIVIGCYVLFLGSYAIDIFHMVQQDRLRLGLGKNPPARAVEAGTLTGVAQPVKER